MMIVDIRSLLANMVLILLLCISSNTVNAAENISDAEKQLNGALVANPASILRMRGTIQNYSASKNAPVTHDYDSEIPQDILNIDDIFDLTLEPDEPAPIIFISKFQSTAVSFLDAYGNPWPIRVVSNFLTGKVEIQRAIPATSTSQNGKNNEQSKQGISRNDPQAGSFTMTALEHGVVGNITVFLEGNAKPITLMLVGKPAMFHRLATIRIGDVGPQTNTSELFEKNGVSLGAKTDPDLNHTLYGVAPDGSEQMVVQGGDGKAWIKGDYLYLQTSLSVFSPEILGASPGNGRFKAYKLVLSPVVMATDNRGQTVSLKIMRSPAAQILDQANLR